MNTELSELIERIEGLPKQKRLCYAVMTGQIVEGYNRTQLSTDDFKALAQSAKALEVAVEALETIKRCEGPFSRDPYKHAQNVIEDAERTATEALATIREMTGE